MHHRAESKGQQMNYKLSGGTRARADLGTRSLEPIQTPDQSPEPLTSTSTFLGNLKTRQILLSNGLGTVLSEMVSQGHCKHGI